MTNLSDFAELKLLIDEYDPTNSDWNFRRTVILDVLARVWPKAARPAGAGEPVAFDKLWDDAEALRSLGSWQYDSADRLWAEIVRLRAAARPAPTREEIAKTLQHLKLETYRPDDAADYAVTIVGQSKAIDAILALFTHAGEPAP